MSTTPPDGPQTGKRPDDARGAPPGRFGNVPFVPTEEQRREVRTYAKTFPVHGEHHIATLIGVSRDTLRRHFKDDLDLGRAQMLAGIGAQVITRAMDAGAATAKGDLDAQKFILARLGGWSTKVEMTGKGGGALETVDLSGMTPAALREYGRQAAIAAGVDPDEAVGPPLDDA
ncbi:MAG: hypothetical protein WKF79_00245 [Nocardioides sp.]